MVVVRKETAKDLPSVNTSVQRARVFYSRCKAEPYYKHSHLVLKRAREARIVEGPVILDQKEDLKRRLANHILAELCLYHPVSPIPLSQTSIPLPLALKNEDVLHELEILNQLKVLDQMGAPKSAYRPLLPRGKKPLALLIQCADYAVTHDTEDMLDGLVDPHPSSIFRAYSSRAQAYEFMRNEARAGELIYAPYAERYGFPLLAGKIMDHAYRINHPEIHAQVMIAMADEVFQARLALTQRIVRQIASHIRAELKRYKFDADVTLRLQKSEGKIMRKVFRLLKADHKASRDHERFVAEACSRLDHLEAGTDHIPLPEESSRAKNDSLEKYIHSAIKGFDFNRLSDWVAARVVLKSYKGKEIIGALNKPFRMAKKVIEHALEMQGIIHGCLEVEHEEKRGGYNADHYDVKAKCFFGQLSEIPLNHEVQLKTDKWNRDAEEGGVAHGVYISEDPELIEEADKADYDILYSSNGNGKH